GGNGHGPFLERGPPEMLHPSALDSALDQAGIKPRPPTSTLREWPKANAPARNFRTGAPLRRRCAGPEGPAPGFRSGVRSGVPDQTGAIRAVVPVSPVEDEEVAVRSTSRRGDARVRRQIAVGVAHVRPDVAPTE